jgi:hypothetical protein
LFVHATLRSTPLCLRVYTSLLSTTLSFSQSLRLVLDSLLVLYAPLARLLGAHIGQCHALLLVVIDIHERHLWDESLGFPRLVDDAVELVDLLERETLGLVDHEPAVGELDVRWLMDGER